MVFLKRKFVKFSIRFCDLDKFYDSLNENFMNVLVITQVSMGLIITGVHP